MRNDREERQKYLDSLSPEERAAEIAAQKEIHDRQEYYRGMDADKRTEAYERKTTKNS